MKFPLSVTSGPALALAIRSWARPPKRDCNKRQGEVGNEIKGFGAKQI